MLIRPRFTDFHGVYIAQNELDFAIPFLNEDIPLYVDPFLLWKSPSYQDKALHQMLLAGFNNFGILVRQGQQEEAIEQLMIASECEEVGLGTSRNRQGKRISRKQALEVLALFKEIPYYQAHGFRHLEEIQLFVEGIGKDRISDIACNLMKSFLIDYTAHECRQLGIALNTVEVANVYELGQKKFLPEKAQLPVHPETKKPLLLIPKRWLRHTPYINYDDYFREYCPQDDIAHAGEELTYVKVLTYNRYNYGVIDSYIREKERTFEDCKNDPLFTQIPIISARRKLNIIKKLATGKENGADKAYEKAIGELFPSLLYPYLDFAQVQARTDSGVSVRDLIFYNSRKHEFLAELLKDYGSRQITMEMKNVQKIEIKHIDQLNRYLTDDLGKFGILITRHPLKKAEFTRTIDLWSGQRKAIITVTDADIEQMVEVFESKQRHPLDVLVKKYVEYRRVCP